MIRKAIIVVLTLGMAISMSLHVWSTLYFLHYKEERVSLLLGGGFIDLSIFDVAPGFPEELSITRTSRTEAEDIRKLYANLARPISTRIPWAYGIKTNSSWGAGTMIILPFWTMIALFASYPTIAFIRGPLRRWRRKKNGLCIECGYDLTGNESGICPECGSKVST
jgi:hypothetical protein